MKMLRLLCCIWILGYVLGIRDGFLALRTGNDSDLVVFPYRAELLPEEDQRRLQEGIPIADCKELSRLLEDYLS